MKFIIRQDWLGKARDMFPEPEFSVKSAGNAGNEGGEWWFDYLAGVLAAGIVPALFDSKEDAVLAIQQHSYLKDPSIQHVRVGDEFICTAMRTGAVFKVSVEKFEEGQ